MAKPSYKKILVRVILLFIYLLIGAAVFQLLERANQLKTKKRYNEVLKGFMLKYNVTLVDMSRLEELISHNGKNSASTNWSYGNAVVFAGTTLLTVGKFSHSLCTREEGGGLLDLNLYGDVPTKNLLSPGSRIFTFK